MAASMAMMAMTTSSSMRVNGFRCMISLRLGCKRCSPWNCPAYNYTAAPAGNKFTDFHKVSSDDHFCPDRLTIMAQNDQSAQRPFIGTDGTASPRFRPFRWSVRFCAYCRFARMSYISPAISRAARTISGQGRSQMSRKPTPMFSLSSVRPAGCSSIIR